MRPSPLLLAVVAMTVSACATGDGRQLAPPEFAPPATTMPEATLPAEPSATVTTPAAPFTLIASWQSGAAIPLRHTCEGENLAPALSWTNVPAGTVELAITVVDLDASGFVHWILYGIDPQITGLAENERPVASVEWTNSAGTIGWFGPCPPTTGETHVYQFTVHALNQRLELADDASANQAISILNQVAVDQGSVTGTFARTG